MARAARHLDIGRLHRRLIGREVALVPLITDICPRPNQDSDSVAVAAGGPRVGRPYGDRDVSMSGSARPAAPDQPRGEHALAAVVGGSAGP